MSQEVEREGGGVVGKEGKGGGRNVWGGGGKWKGTKLPSDHITFLVRKGCFNPRHVQQRKMQLTTNSSTETEQKANLPIINSSLFEIPYRRSC